MYFIPKTNIAYRIQTYTDTRTIQVDLKRDHTLQLIIGELLTKYNTFYLIELKISVNKI